MTHRRRWLRLTLGLVCWLGLAGFGWAAEEGEGSDDAAADAALAPVTVYTPGDVIVIGQREPAEIVASMEELTADDIRALGANNAAEALRAIAGMRVDTAPTSLSSNGKMESLASLRGFDPRDLIVLIDGVPVYEPYFRVLDLRQIPVGNIAKITVMKGPTSVLYGPNALGGVINIVTRRGEGLPRGQVGAAYGDVDTWRGHGLVSGGANGWDYFAHASFSDSAGYLMSRDFGQTRNDYGDVRENSDARTAFVAANAGYYHGLTGLTLTADHYQFAGGVPFSMEAVEPATLWRETWKKTGAALHGQWAATDFLLLRGRAFYSRYFNTITTYEDTNLSVIASGGEGVSTYDNDIFGYVLLPEFLLGRFGTFTLSHIYKRDIVRIQDEDRGEWYRYGAETYCAGGEYGLHVYRFDFTLGGAYNVYRRNETPTEQLGGDDSAFDYQAGLAYTPIEQVTIHAGGAHKSAFPDLKTLYGSNGNPDLNPEFADNIDAGLRVRPIPQLGLESTYFFSDVTDLIGKRDLGNQFYYENIDSARIQGVENLVRVRLFDGLFFAQGSYTWMSTHDNRESRNLHELDFRPRHTAFVDGRLNLPWGTALEAQFYYVGERKYELPDAGQSIRTLPEYGITNARLSQTIRWDERRTACELFLQARNVFDVYYEESPEKAAPGRNLLAGFALDF